MSLNLVRSLSALWQKSVILARLNCTSKVLLFRIPKSTSAISKMAVYIYIYKKKKKNSTLFKCARCPEAQCTVSWSKSLAWSVCAGKAHPAQLFCHGQSAHQPGIKIPLHLRDVQQLSLTKLNKYAENPLRNTLHSFIFDAPGDITRSALVSNSIPGGPQLCRVELQLISAWMFLVLLKTLISWIRCV